MSSDPNKKYKRPKKKTLVTTFPEPATSRTSTASERHNECPLLAKDSEWVDILQTEPGPVNPSHSDEEEVLQLVECEDGPQMKPLAIMFPGLLDKDPQTLKGMLSKSMSTTEVTKTLVDLGQKANFTFMKKADRLIPPEKQWLESLTENSNSVTSFVSEEMCYRSSNIEANNELSERDLNMPRRKKSKERLAPPKDFEYLSSNEGLSASQSKPNERKL